MAEYMRNMTLRNIATACGGELHQTDGSCEQITCAVIDSRKMEPGGLFFASEGEKVDGHQFISQVFYNGAACVITEKTPEQVAAEKGIESEKWGSYILVNDTLKALRDIAAFYRNQLTIPIVGITGSVGKTSTKEFIAGVLSEKYTVLKTEGNYNNGIGVPLTLLRIREKHQAAVIEMGISDFGEMSVLGEMAKPNICVITNIGQCHLDKLHDRAGIFKAKTEIFRYMQPDGEVCLNGEDDILPLVSVVNGKPVHLFGVSQNEDFEVYGTDIENHGLMGSCTTMHIDIENTNSIKAYKVNIPLPGSHMVNNAMAAALVGKLLGLSVEQIENGIQNVKPLGGRSHIIKMADKIVIDDCYNANPVSMRAAIDLLNMADGRKVAILGDMLNLGEHSDMMHAKVGVYAAEQGIDEIICVGNEAKYMYEAAEKNASHNTTVTYFETREEMQNNLSSLLKAGDTILLKASHGMEFSKVLETLV